MSKKMSQHVICILSIFCSISSFGEETTTILDPAKALEIAERLNPEIASFKARAEAEDSLILSASWLDRPKLGLMREQNLNNMQLAMGPMTSWSISQEVKFPLKYFSTRSAQSAKASASAFLAQDKLLEVRQKTLAAFYGWYSSVRIAALLEAQKETLREIARAAEARRATGAAPQQDEMKAHVEQTRIENEILLQSQETAENEAILHAFLNSSSEQKWILTKDELKAPKIDSSVLISNLTEKALRDSKSVHVGESMLDVAKSERTLAWLAFTPDFMLSYRQAFVNAPPNAYAVAIEASIPLWFFTKEIPEVRAARSKAIEAEKNLERMKRETESDIKSLGTKVESYVKLLQIYETSLIPQSISMLNSSRSAYGAGRASFIELLDSERSLYTNRITYYQTLAKYVDSLAKLERSLGSSISDLPFYGGTL